MILNRRTYSPVLVLSGLDGELGEPRVGIPQPQTDDRSRNNPVVALFAIGAGWHNNHHHKQVAANHGPRWWEVDLSFLVIVMTAVVAMFAAR